MINPEQMAKEWNLRFLLQKFVTKAQLNADQERWLEEYESDERIVHVNGDRASGRTTFGLGIVAIESLIKPLHSSMVMCRRHEIAMSHAILVGEIIEEVFGHYGLYKAFRVRNKSTQELDNGSRIFFSTDNPHNFRGRTLNTLFFDFSCGTMENIGDEIMENCFPSLCSTQGRLLVSL